MKAGTRRILRKPQRQVPIDREVIHVAEFIKNRFCLMTFKRNTSRLDTNNAHYFSTDHLFLYQGFYEDFGPLNLGMFYRYYVLVAKKLNSKEYSKKVVVHYTTTDPRKRANAAFLASAFAVVYFKVPPRVAWNLLSSQEDRTDIPPSELKYLPFRDAQPYTNKDTLENTISIYDCIKAMDIAFYYNIANFRNFHLKHYEAFQVNGYSLLNWIVPSKLLALCNPSNDSISPFHIGRIIKYFSLNDVGVVVRLNESTYDPLRFSNAGIRHVDMYFDDGTPPTQRILNEFLRLVEGSSKAVAVHCRAGLGRTGSLIGAYLIKHYRMTSKEAVAWLRICRPGSVISYQQAWLDTVQSQLWECGDLYRLKKSGFQLPLVRHKQGIYNKHARKK